MLNIQRFVCNPFQENTYVVSDETQECVIIDCGAFFPDERLAVIDYINGNALIPKHLLCTHGHFDHCVGNELIFTNYGLKPEIHAADEPMLQKLDVQMKMFLGVEQELLSPKAGKLLDKNTIVEFGTHAFTVLETPGHTHGGICFYCEPEKTLFSGDTLFRMSIGRTDFEEGNYTLMRNSLHGVLAQLPSDTVVLSGHGLKTTIGEEVAMNPYMRL